MRPTRLFLDYLLDLLIIIMQSTTRNGKAISNCHQSGQHYGNVLRKGTLIAVTKKREMSVVILHSLLHCLNLCSKLVQALCNK